MARADTVKLALEMSGREWDAYVIRLFPIHIMLLMVLVHLLLACSLAAPVLDMRHIYRKPSFGEPKVAR